jgi:16S rRNA (cytosine1402-N4)-methyltransferase
MAMVMTSRTRSSDSEPPADHRSVLAEEAVDRLVWDPAGIYVDGTAGLGGHTARIAARLSPRGRVLALDRDEESLALAARRTAAFAGVITFCRDNFKNLPLILNRSGIPAIHGLLLDLGISSYQLGQPERGFSFQADGPLDMRMDQRQKATAADLLATLPAEEIARILFEYGEERRSRAIARKIVEARKVRRLATTAQLAALVEEVLGPRRKGMIHPATRTFQALRIAVNNELEGLGELLERMAGLLVPGGRLVVISFHSLEDRIVKHVFQRLEGRCICRRPLELCTCPRRPVARVLTRKPVEPSDEEVRDNPRARSAKLRALERLPVE